MYRISVVIPTYNREKYIEKSLRSVLEQEKQGKTFEITEVVIVDDGSVDDTKGVIDRIGDDRIVYHKFEQNRGALVAWNTGIRMTKGDWIAFQDSDDEWHPDKLVKQVKYASEHTDCDLISHPFRAFFTDGRDVTTKVYHGEDIIRELAVQNFIGTPTMLIRREAIWEMGGFKESIKALQDWDFVIRFADKYKIGMIDDVLLNVNMIVEGMSADASKYYESRCKIISDNRDILMRHGCFEDAVKSLFLHAEKNDLLETVGKMLELYLKG